LGAVPRVLVWDGEGAIGRWRGRRSELTVECQGFRGTPATKVVVCLPADPEAKGLVERLHDYLVARAAPSPRGQARSGLERYLIQQAVRRPGYGPAHCMLTVRPTARLVSASQLVDVDHQA
jgi:hypothetical protein